jgi:hypothetical protein
MTNRKSPSIGTNRRDFLKLTATVAGLAPIASGLLLEQALANEPEASWGLLDLKDPMAQALGYVEQAAKVDVKKWPKFKEPKNQACWNCTLYTKSVKGKGKETAGVCGVFAPQKKLVKAYGWCNSWAENKNAKEPAKS